MGKRKTLEELTAQRDRITAQIREAEAKRDRMIAQIVLKHIHVDKVELFDKQMAYLAKAIEQQKRSAPQANTAEQR